MGSSRSRQGGFYDVVVVGGGPAGLSAAMVLGRCCRKVAVFDEGRPRNDRSHAVHGLLGHDGIPPAELLRIGRIQLATYDVQLHSAAVRKVRARRGVFEIEADGGVSVRARRLLLATGLRDRLPRMEGFDAIYGRTGFHCPVCDGWENRGQPWAAIAHGTSGVEYALALLTWTRDLILFTDGHHLRVSDLQHLADYRVGVRTTRIERLEQRKGELRALVLEGGEVVARTFLFFHLGVEQRSDLAVQLGCEFRKSGSVRIDRLGRTSVPGVFAVGDSTGDAYFVAVAMSEGTKAAYAINKSLREESLP